MRMLIWIRAASLVPLTVVLAAAASQAPSFRSRTDLVALTVTVLDDKGMPLPRLGQDSFTISEDGEPRPIAHFAAGEIPISLVVALDCSESMRGARFDASRKAVAGFLDRLGPEDEFTIVGFNDRAFSITPWTSSPEAILGALGRIEPSGATALYAAVSTAIDGLRGSRNRRQAVVIISDGNDQLDGERAGSAATRLAARRRSLPVIERVQHSEALVYAIGADPPDTPPPYRLDSAALRELTDPSGGSTSVVYSDAGISEAADRIGAELRRQYVLGFAPAHPADGRFHKVHVSVSGCARCRVHVRSGYIAERAPVR
jgi:Ca-activated chloride channel homolog